MSPGGILDDEGALDRVGQLADVPRPGMVEERLAGVAAQAGLALAHPGAQRPDEVVGEEQDVLSPLRRGGRWTVKTSSR